MKMIKSMLVFIIVVGLVLQGFVGQAFASDAGNEIAKLNEASGSQELLNQKAGEGLPSSFQPLNSDEMKTLIAEEAGNSRLLNQRAGKEVCYDVGAGQIRCKTTHTHAHLKTGVLGAVGGGVIGMLGGTSGVLAGAAIGFSLFAFMNWALSEEE